MFEARETTKFAVSFVVRKHRPETFSGNVGHFVSHEVDMVMGGGLRTSLEAGGEIIVGPAGGAGDNRHAMIMEGDEEAGWGRFSTRSGESRWLGPRVVAT
jgi:hypothetical protein